MPDTWDREGYDSLGRSSRDHTFGNWRQLLGISACFTHHRTQWDWPRAGQRLKVFTIPRDFLLTSWEPLAGCEAQRRKRISQQGAGRRVTPEKGTKANPVTEKSRSGFRVTTLASPSGSAPAPWAAPGCLGTTPAPSAVRGPLGHRVCVVVSPQGLELTAAGDKSGPLCCTTCVVLGQ